MWQVHGKLIQLAVLARPDLAHAVSVLSSYVHNPSVKLWEAYQHVRKYLVRTKDFPMYDNFPCMHFPMYDKHTSYVSTRESDNNSGHYTGIFPCRDTTCTRVGPSGTGEGCQNLGVY